MTRTGRTCLLALLAGLVILCGGCRDRSGVLALVLAVKGDVTLAEPAARRLTPGAEIASPSTIRTAANGAVVFSPLPGMMIRLEAGGEISVDRIELRKRGEEVESRIARLYLRKGRARVWVDEYRTGVVDLQIRTPAGDASIRGPVLAEVAWNADGSARLICVSGELWIAGTALTTGQWAANPPGQNAPAAQLAADTDEIWKGLLDVRNLEPQFLDLQARQRQRTPIRKTVPPEAFPKK
jgi:hypothetical protein